MGKFNRIILLSDMDGTLLNSENNVSAKNKKAIEYFIAEGGEFGIATGRSYLNAKKILQGVSINGLSIYANGSLLYDSLGQKYLAVYNIESKKIIPFLEKCLQEKPEISIQIHTKDMCYYVSEEVYEDKRIIKDHEPCKFANLQEIYEETWVKVLCCGTTDDLTWIKDHSNYLETRKDISRTYSGGSHGKQYYELLPMGVNKGKMIIHMRRYLSTDCKIYAVGDYYNDIEMIRNADIGIATANAPGELQEMADYVCADCNEGAIADIIENIL